MKKNHHLFSILLYFAGVFFSVSTLWGSGLLSMSFPEECRNTNLPQEVLAALCQKIPSLAKTMTAQEDAQKRFVLLQDAYRRQSSEFKGKYPISDVCLMGLAKDREKLCRTLSAQSLEALHCASCQKALFSS